MSEHRELLIAARAVATLGLIVLLAGAWPLPVWRLLLVLAGMLVVTAGMWLASLSDFVRRHPEPKSTAGS